MIPNLLPGEQEGQEDAMCSHYEGVRDAQVLRQLFQVEPPADLGKAGLWAAWPSPQGEWVHSYTLLTINADAHPLMNRFHKPTDEKRMVVVLPEAAYDGWLMATAERSLRFLVPFEPKGLRLGNGQD